MIFLGDVNLDGKIDTEDLVLLELHVGGKLTLTGDNFKAADINKDGILDTTDLAKLRLHLTGREIINGVIE